jgi:hypothetical protein
MSPLPRRLQMSLQHRPVNSTAPRRLGDKMSSVSVKSRTIWLHLGYGALAALIASQISLLQSVEYFGPWIVFAICFVILSATDGIAFHRGISGAKRAAITAAVVLSSWQEMSLSHGRSAITIISTAAVYWAFEKCLGLERSWRKNTRSTSNVRYWRIADMDRQRRMTTFDPNSHSQ